MLKNGVLFRIEIREKFVANASVLPPARAIDLKRGKRRVLMQEGISPSNLLITVLRKPDGEGHAVLTVRTDQGDFILDNLTDSVVPWDETGYIFLKRQATDHTGLWVTILEGAQEPLVGSVQ